MFSWLDNCLVTWNYWQTKVNFHNWWSRKELVEVSMGVPKDLGYEVTTGGRCGGCNGKLNMVKLQSSWWNQWKGEIVGAKVQEFAKTQCEAKMQNCMP
jgi:hypothetical protein